MRLLWKLLRKHVSGVQLAGFFVTNLVGVAIILAAVQLWRDVRPAVEAPDSFMSSDYMILSHEGGFTEIEIEDFAEQPFVESVGKFTAARYPITGGIRVMGMGFETWLFFESVPDDFLDVRTEDWTWSEGDTTIPIILPRNYLNLYNFGFASTQGLPQVNEAVVGSVPMKITIGGKHEFEGRVVAFSNRLNTILVPESFMAWSNERFADRPAKEALRIIAEVPNEADEGLHRWITEHRYTPEGDRGGAGQTAYLLRVAVGVVGGVGVVIALLSVFVLMLSVFLLLQKNAKKLQDLLLLGYSPAQVSRPYILLTAGLNVAVLLCAMPIIIYARARYMPYVEMLGSEPATFWPTVLWGLGAVAIVSLINALAIRRRVNKLW